MSQLGLLGQVASKCKELQVGFRLEWRNNGKMMIVGTPIFEKGESSQPLQPFIAKGDTAEEVEAAAKKKIMEFFSGVAVELTTIAALRKQLEKEKEELEKQLKETRANASKAKKKTPAAAKAEVKEEPKEADAQLTID